MNKIFDFSNNYAYELRCSNYLSRSIVRISELRLLQLLLLKYGIRYLTISKKHAPLQFLKVKLENGFQRVALVDFAKHMGDKWVLYYTY